MDLRVKELLDSVNHLPPRVALLRLKQRLVKLNKVIDKLVLKEGTK